MQCSGPYDRALLLNSDLHHCTSRPLRTHRRRVIRGQIHDCDNRCLSHSSMKIFFVRKDILQENGMAHFIPSEFQILASIARARDHIKCGVNKDNLIKIYTKQ